MTAELGVFFLIIALLAALLQSSFLWPNPNIKNLVASCLATAAWLQSLAITLALAALIALRLDNDFSVTNVALHSSRTLPVLYKIGGAWGNHEGSMLLFALVLALFGLLLAMRRGHGITSLAVAVQSLLSAGILLFVLFTSNPFARRFPPPPDGEVLNPLLQDIALSLHPPLLYLGYVGFSIVFSLAVAALLHPQIVMKEWAKLAHPWIVSAWSFLTLGIGLGSWWAYRELGWGGWWFWDPVENASLLPWLAGTALFHSNIVLKKRGLLAPWVILLAILTFGLSLLGTFLVRSGALVSVHGFANDPERGLFILGYIALAVGGALLLFALRAGRLASPGAMLPASREGLIVANNLFLLSACATVLLGTVYPLLAEALGGERLTVGAPYFNATFLPLMALPLAMAGLAPLVPWQRASLNRAAADAFPALLAAMAALLLVLAFARTEIVLAALGFGLSAWLIAGSLQWLRRGAGNRWPVFLGHLGAAVMVAGITAASLWKEETDRLIAGGDIIFLAGYNLAWQAQPSVRGANYDARRGEFIVSDSNGKTLTVLSPEYRTYDIVRTATSEADIHSTWAGDLYAVIGQSPPGGNRTSARIYYLPMIRFIWLGFVLMACGGIAACLRRSEAASASRRQAALASRGRIRLDQPAL